MFEIKLYKFNKKINSTLKPDASTPSVTLNCNIKTDSSIINPVIELKTNPLGYNYCYIQKFNRYYFINDIVYSIGYWTLSLNVDVLASFKSDITSSTQYVLRSSSAYNDNILDTFYGTKASSSNNYAIATASSTVVDPDYSLSIADYFNKSFNDGVFIIGVISNNNSGVTYYQLSYASFTTLLTSLMNYVPDDIDDVSDGIAKSLFDPLQYITSCTWYPSSMARGMTPVLREIKIGGYTVDVGIGGFGSVISNRVCHFKTTVSIPKHPQYNEYSYTQLEPFSRYNLFFEPFGNIPLDSVKLYGASSLNLDWYVDSASGEAELFITNGAMLIANVSAMMGVQVRLSQLTVDVLGGTNSFVNGVGGVINGAITGDIFGAIMSGINGITSTTASMLPQLSTKGNEGSFLPYSLGAPKLHAFYNLQVDTNPDKYGRPLCEVKTLSSLRGYCICDKAVITSSCTGDEKETIEAYLNGGFYIE